LDKLPIPRSQHAHTSSMPSLKVSMNTLSCLMRE
jgi:hypothetical protein